jgi:hypothetical protein
LDNDDVRAAFLSAYGDFDERERWLDEAVSVLTDLITACRRPVFPGWANDSLAFVKDGGLLAAVERLLKECV